IDRSLLAGSEVVPPGVYFREVPGGCMCCTAGVPMQVALNALLRESRPHRLLIEPTGLGHPQEVLMALAADHYRDVIDIRATIALVDARKAHNPRYTGHATFVQQLDIADVIVANKSDQCGPDDLRALREFLGGDEGLEGRPLYQVKHGAIDLEWLDGKAVRYDPGPQSRSPEISSLEVSPLQAPPGGHLRVDNKGQGFFSAGWIFDIVSAFDVQDLRNLLWSIRVQRAKGSVRTPEGNLGFNLADGVLTEFPLGELSDSRLEFISDDSGVFEELEEALLDCVSTASHTRAAEGERELDDDG
ncbi:MAG: GTP-binding protein, partial [Planctomycetota bacterium]